MRLKLSSSLFVVLLCLPAQASDWHKIPGELASPWTTPARPWLIGGSMLTVGILMHDETTEDPLQQSWSQQKPLGDWAEVGDLGGQAIPNAAYALGMMGMYWHSQDKLYSRRATLMAKASAYAISVNYLLKITVRQQRPNGTDYKSFPSGHSASAFAFSTVVWAEHGWQWGIPATLLSTLTAASRINDNMHFLHDVVAGATVGISYGLGLYYFTKDLDAPKTTASWSFAPIVTRDVQMALLSYSF